MGSEMCIRDRFNFIWHALSKDSGISFETPIALLIPRIPTASIIGDSFLAACGGYSITLEFWWYLTSPSDVMKRTLLHLKDNSDELFILINCVKYVTIIMDHCASIVVFASRKIKDDPHPVVLCVTDNTSALNLARFFCGLMIGSNVGVNAKWISMIKNVIADKISRLKKFTASNSNSPSSQPYDYSNLQQEHEELRACYFFQTSHKLVSLLWEILLTKKCPDLSLIQSLRPQSLGKLSI